MPIHREECTTEGGAQISIETGNWAKQAHASIVYSTGDLGILATVCAEKDAKEGQEFFPLTVDYREKYYSVGRVPGGYFKRENRPQEQETLTSRLIDRPIRPLFPEGYFSEVQLLVTVLSSSGATLTEGHAITAASAVLTASDIPFNGPIAGVLVGRIDGKLIADPTREQLKAGDLELAVAGSETEIVMIEGSAKELTNDEMVEAVRFAHAAIQPKIQMQKRMAAKVALKKREVKLRIMDPALKTEVQAFALEKLRKANLNADKVKRSNDIDAINKETVDHFKAKFAANATPQADMQVKQIKEFLHELEYLVVRSEIFDNNRRADGRKPDEIRDISVELDVLPGVHGSSVFTRGQTQSLGVVTLGTGSDYQRYENLAGQQQKHFMLHYNFTPYSTGEVKRIAGPARREIGHGNLAERALKNIVPPNETFPYVIRVVSEILESNGSSSMASVCSASLALMAAGVPVKAAVSGIAMGLITNDDGRHAIISDIAGLEDHFGDMDFKVAGTAKGITAFQMDIKVNGIQVDILNEALAAAEKGRMHILGIMDKAIDKARPEISPNAPRITTMQIDTDRIGELIGPGGKIIRAIIEKSGAELNVEDTGVVTIASLSTASNDLARRMIADIFAEVEVGRIYDGKVKKIADFGAFIEIAPGKEGLMHISRISNERVTSVRDVLNEGDAVQVRVIGVDRQGRIDLANKDVDAASRPPRERSDRDHGRGGPRGGHDRGHDGPGRDGGHDRPRGDHDRPRREHSDHDRPRHDRGGDHKPGGHHEGGGERGGARRHR
ncbi:MAG: polyribonucleotide nucleotidyltransferase [Spirochaetia bacterium]|nr:polyribonucleotide nucleotidyltransferase [Spirochaetia bacterium]